MNTFTLHARLQAETTNPVDIENLFKAFCATNGLTVCTTPEEYGGECDLRVERTNFLEGDIIWEIWEHQGEDGPGCIDIVRSAEAAEYAVLSQKMQHNKRAWSKQVTVTKSWLGEYYEDMPE